MAGLLSDLMEFITCPAFDWLSRAAETLEREPQSQSKDGSAPTNSNAIHIH